MVELALGWQIARPPLAGAGQAANACEDRQSTAATNAKLIFTRCRDGYFMTMGPQGTGNFERTYAWVKAIQKPSCCSLKIVAAGRVDAQNGQRSASEYTRRVDAGPRPLRKRPGV